MHTAQSLKQDLVSAGFSGGETVLIHSSMKSIGEVEGRAEGVLDFLCDFFHDGLLVFPTLSYASVRETVNPVFRPLETPACTGILPELFRKRPGVVRSLHPLHSLAALGKDAEEFTAGHEKFTTAFDPLSPWGKLVSRKAKVLLIGVDLDSMTFLHAVEQWAGVKILSQKPLHLYVEDHAGNTLSVPVYWHTGAHSTRFHVAEKMLADAGILHYCVFGSAPSMVIDCCACCDFLMAELKKNPDLFKPEPKT